MKVSFEWSFGVKKGGAARDDVHRIRTYIWHMQMPVKNNRGHIVLGQLQNAIRVQAAQKHPRGAPNTRRRIYVMVHKNNERLRATPILREQLSCRGQLVSPDEAERIGVGEKASDCCQESGCQRPNPGRS
jgi:hypothetical protein